MLQVDWGEHVGAGDYIVGVGTLALAAGTVWLAQHAARQTELTKETIEAADRPFVIASPHEDHREGLGFETTASGLDFLYRLWNIGRGPAMVFRVSLQEDDGKRELLSFSTPQAIAVDGVVDITNEIEQFTHPLQQKFTLRVIYQDGSRRTYQTKQELWRDGTSMRLIPVWFERKRLRAGEIGAVLDAMRG